VNWFIFSCAIAIWTFVYALAAARDKDECHQENWFIFLNDRQLGAGVCLGVQPVQSISRAMLVA
jgi:hypothetical protein